MFGKASFSGSKTRIPRSWRSGPAVAVQLLVPLLAATAVVPAAPAGASEPRRALPVQVATVFGDDNRRKMTVREKRQLGAVGLVHCERDDAPLTSGVIISVKHLDPKRNFDIVATVAHAFYDRWGRLYSSDCYFYPRGVFVRDNRVRITNFRVGTRNYNDDSRDWAVAVVSRRLSDKYGALGYTVLKLGSRTKKKIRYLFAGLNYRTSRIDVSDKCGAIPKKPQHYLFDDHATFNHNCDLEVGASGGPLLIVERDRFYVVAVQAAQVNGGYELSSDGRIRRKRIRSAPSRGFDPAFNPNIAVRVDGRFRSTIDELARTGGVKPTLEAKRD